MQTTVYFNGGAKVTVKESAKDLWRKLDQSAIAEFKDTKEK